MSGETLLFWGIAAALTIVALGILVAPLLRRRPAVAVARETYDINVYKDQLAEIDRDLDRRLLDDRQAAAARIEIKRRMLAAADKIDTTKVDQGGNGALSNAGLTAVILLVLPAAAVALYLNLGNPGKPDQPLSERTGQSRVAGNGKPSNLQSVAAQLEKRLQSEPDDLDGWMLLGRSYLSLSQYSDAAGAYGRAYELSGKDPDVGAEYAESLTLASDSSITPLAVDIFKSSLAADPFNPKARYYLAMAKAQEGDTRGALQGWVDLAAISPADAPWNQILSQQIARAGEEIGVDPKTFQPSPEAAVLARQMEQSQPQITPVPENTGPGPTSAEIEAAAEMTSDERTAMIRTMVKRLADRLQENPDDKAGWQRLEKVYRVLGETAKADQAAATAAKLP